MWGHLLLPSYLLFWAPTPSSLLCSSSPQTFGYSILPTRFCPECYNFPPSIPVGFCVIPIVPCVCSYFLFYFIGDGHRNCFSVYVKRQIAFVSLVKSESPVGVPSAACLPSWERTLLFWLFELLCNFVLAHRCDCDMWGLCPLPLRPLFLSFSGEILQLFLNKKKCFYWLELVVPAYVFCFILNAFYLRIL